MHQIIITFEKEPGKLVLKRKSGDTFTSVDKTLNDELGDFLFEPDADEKLHNAAQELLDACRMALHTLDCIDVTRRPGTTSNRLQAAIDKAVGA